MAAFRLEELTKEEGEALTAELQAVLAKYNVEMGTHTQITLLKRVESDEPIVSPIQVDGNNNTSEENKETKAD